MLDRSYLASAKRFRVRYTLSEIVSELFDEKTSEPRKLLGFIQPSRENAGGSNPTPGALGQNPYIESRLIQKIELSALSEIINFGLWMRKQG